MGEVYRAKDLRLDRDVALQVLPAVVASHVDRLAHFEREAYTVTSLNHPNIVVLYSVEDEDCIRRARDLRAARFRSCPDRTYDVLSMAALGSSLEER
jgi:serine/threonine protein kinase